jgi:hypothetical protein
MQHPVLLHQRFQGQSVSLLTADELYWDKIIKRKYQTSLDFYALLKHMAVDCRSNLVLNVQSAQDTHLTCYEYPYDKGVGDWKDEEAPLYAPLDLEAGAGVHSAGARAVDVARAVGQLEPRHAIQLRVGDGGEPVQCGGLS